MSRELTSTGFIETSVVHHEIKIVKAIISVNVWHNLNEMQKGRMPSNRLSCQRCLTPWKQLPMDGNVNLCMMQKGVNITICDNCYDQIDDNLKIK